MKRLISGICIYVLAVLLVLLPFEIWKIVSRADYGNAPGVEVRCAVKTSKTKHTGKIRKLILGDSTGHALYPSEKEYDNIASMACNQAITMAGHYFLLKNYLENNADNLPQEIIVLFTPETFGNDVDMFAYQYFLKPFPIWEYKSDYSAHLYKRIKSIPFYWTANLPFIQTSGYTPLKSVPAAEERTSMSELSYEYLVLMDSIAKAYHVPFSMRSTPVRDDKQEETAVIIKDLETICAGSLNDLMVPYIQSIPFYPAEMFFDHAHLKPEHTPQDYLGVLE